MSRMRTTAIAVLGVAALALPSAAIANQGENHGHDHGKSQTHNVAYVFKGAYEGESMVKVEHGNARVRKGGLIGQTVTFDLTSARITVADTNSDGTSGLDDVQVGDRVVIKARLPKNDPGTQPFAAKHLVDQTHPAE